MSICGNMSRKIFSQDHNVSSSFNFKDFLFDTQKYAFKKSRLHVPELSKCLTSAISCNQNHTLRKMYGL